MNDPQFKALAKLLRMREGPAKEAVRLVLVYHYETADAAREVGMEYQAAHQAVKRVRAGLELAKIAAGNS